MGFFDFLGLSATSQPENQERERGKHGVPPKKQINQQVQENPNVRIQDDEDDSKCWACSISRRNQLVDPCKGCSLTPFFPYSRVEEFHRIWKRVGLTKMKKVVANYKASEVMKKLYELVEEEEILKLKRQKDDMESKLGVLRRQLKGKGILEIRDIPKDEEYQMSRASGAKGRPSQLKISDEPAYNLSAHGAAEAQHFPTYAGAGGAEEYQMLRASGAKGRPSQLKISDEPAYNLSAHGAAEAQPCPTYAGAAAGAAAPYTLTYQPMPQPLPLLMPVPQLSPYQYHGATPSNLLSYVQTPQLLQNQHYPGIQSQMFPTYHPHWLRDAHLFATS